MSVEQNKEIARRLVEETFNRGNLGIIDELLVPNFIEHEILPAGIPSSREGFKQLVGMQLKAFPDTRATIDDLIAEGDKVVIRMTHAGTQKGEFMGMPSSGKHVSITIIDILRFDGGKIVEHWGLSDTMGMMQQLGVIPPQR